MESITTTLENQGNSFSVTIYNSLFLLLHQSNPLTIEEFIPLRSIRFTIFKHSLKDSFLLSSLDYYRRIQLHTNPIFFLNPSLTTVQFTQSPQTIGTKIRFKHNKTTAKSLVKRKKKYHLMNGNVPNII